MAESNSDNRSGGATISYTKNVTANIRNYFETEYVHVDNELYWPTKCPAKEQTILEGLLGTTPLASDVIADVGGGDGWLADLMLRFHEKLNFPLPKSFYLVDPSAALLKKSEARDAFVKSPFSIRSFQQGAEDFAESTLSMSPSEMPNKIYFVDCIHHVPESSVPQSLWKMIPEGGYIYIFHRPTVHCYPFFEAAFQDGRHNFPDSIIYATALEEAGFSLTKTTNVEQVSLPSDVWIDMCAKRFFSNLAFFNDDELRKGVEELKVKYSGEEYIEFEEPLEFFIARKITKLR